MVFFSLLFFVRSWFSVCDVCELRDGVKKQTNLTPRCSLNTTQTHLHKDNKGLEESHGRGHMVEVTWSQRGRIM